MIRTINIRYLVPGMSICYLPGTVGSTHTAATKTYSKAVFGCSLGRSVCTHYVSRCRQRYVGITSAGTVPYDLVVIVSVVLPRPGRLAVTCTWYHALKGSWDRT